MARSPFVDNISTIHKKVWPAVSAKWAEMREKGGRSNRTRDRLDAVLWELADAGYLRTDADLQLLEALTFYYENYEVEDEDSAVYRAFLAVKGPLTE